MKDEGQTNKWTHIKVFGVTFATDNMTDYKSCGAVQMRYAWMPKTLEAVNSSSGKIG